MHTEQPAGGRTEAALFSVQWVHITKVGKISIAFPDNANKSYWFNIL